MYSGKMIDELIQAVSRQERLVHTEQEHEPEAACILAFEMNSPMQLHGAA